MFSKSSEDEQARFERFMNRTPDSENDSGKGYESCLPVELRLGIGYEDSLDMASSRPFHRMDHAIRNVD